MTDAAREFIAGLGSAAAWPLAARAKQGERVRRIGALMGWSDAGNAHDIFAAFVGRLVQLGWIEGRNVQSSSVGLTGMPNARSR
jgi:putative ABC transport system substrate-binding protein